ncbi:hypothetical protein BTO25_03885 [Bacillus sp. MB366]|uniref:Uncharacterized protein n=1 Tax=Bacillus cereus TaxID=1396 RepID=A0ABD7R9F7_BACCE|nr:MULTISPECIES: hypothetical protein [Bacillus]MDA2247572.1 hypothetical protein [Bacillus cereus]OLR83675.1 hypothetical protein BTO25_03885 [Bacillus sp. MB366]TNB92549.1 hypothetical protein FHG65_26375 [Bacillus cereus]
MEEFKTKRVEVSSAAAKGSSLDFFVVTGSTKDPIVTVADNKFYPHVRDIYARYHYYQNLHHGVRIAVNFEEEARGEGFAVTIAQPGMVGDYTVIPM